MSVDLSRNFPFLSFIVGSRGLKVPQISFKFWKSFWGFWFLLLCSNSRHNSSSYCPLHCFAFPCYFVVLFPISFPLMYCCLYLLLSIRHVMH